MASKDKEINIDCSTLLNNKALILNVTPEGKIVANLYDLSPPQTPPGTNSDSSNAQTTIISETEQQPPYTTLLEATIPKGVEAGGTFEIKLADKMVDIIVPTTGYKSGDKLKFYIPETPKKEGPPPPPPQPFNVKQELQKVLKGMMTPETNMTWLPRVFLLKEQQPTKGSYKMVLEEQSILELVAGIDTGTVEPTKPLSKMACTGLDVSSHTNVVSYLLGFPIVPPDKEREQLIGDIVKILAPIQSISEGKQINELQEHSRQKLKDIKKLCDKLLLASQRPNTFKSATARINKIILPKDSGTEKEKKDGGGRKTRKRRYKLN